MDRTHVVEGRLSDPKHIELDEPLGIVNARSNKQRKKLYRDLLSVARKTLSDGKRVRAALQRGPTSDPIQAMVIEVELQHYSVLAERVIAQTEKRVLGAEFVPHAR